VAYTAKRTLSAGTVHRRGWSGSPPVIVHNAEMAAPEIRAAIQEFQATGSSGSIAPVRRRRRRAAVDDRQTARPAQSERRSPCSRGATLSALIASRKAKHIGETLSPVLSDDDCLLRSDGFKARLALVVPQLIPKTEILDRMTASRQAFPVLPQPLLYFRDLASWSSALVGGNGAAMCSAKAADIQY